MDHKSVICIPLNDAGVRGLEYPAEYKDENYRIIDISDDDYRRLFWLFGKFSDEFDIIIDTYEEEMIAADQIPRAIELAKEFKAGKHDAEDIAAIDKLIAAMEFAKERRVDIELAF